MKKRQTADAALSLRPAGPQDYGFAAGLYLDGMKRNLVALGRWDKARVTARFKQGYKPDQARVIQLARTDIGWMQVSEGASGFHLHQLHIVPERRDQGIGTGLIQALLERAAAKGKPVMLNVVRGNRALSLYQRLGFRQVGEDEEKLRLRWEPPARPGAKRG